ncbi:hypothetical protein [Acinetobacter colistiniresistens]|uniref:hypothetical protein n=1 Tax=Acinetobacter colistiniresistens TaxID=280145 RepID=UPI0012507FFA|nr:hypothetical protein [Acinetobacter colistiniresistens]
MIAELELQTGAFHKCELNVLVDMYMEGQKVEYIAEVLNRSMADIQKQIRFKGLETIRAKIQKDEQLKRIVAKHCGEPA